MLRKLRDSILYLGRALALALDGMDKASIEIGTLRMEKADLQDEIALRDATIVRLVGERETALAQHQAAMRRCRDLEDQLRAKIAVQIAHTVSREIRRNDLAPMN